MSSKSAGQGYRSPKLPPTTTRSPQSSHSPKGTEGNEVLERSGVRTSTPIRADGHNYMMSPQRSPIKEKSDGNINIRLGSDRSQNSKHTKDTGESARQPFTKANDGGTWKYKSPDSSNSAGKAYKTLPKVGNKPTSSSYPNSPKDSLNSPKSSLNTPRDSLNDLSPSTVPRRRGRRTLLELQSEASRKSTLNSTMGSVVHGYSNKPPWKQTKNQAYAPGLENMIPIERLKEQTTTPRTPMIEPPGPYSNNVLAPHGRIPESKQQSTLFKKGKDEKNYVATHVHGFKAQSSKYPSSSTLVRVEEYGPYTNLYRPVTPKEDKVKIVKQKMKIVKQPKVKLSKSESNFVRFAIIVHEVGTELLRIAFHNYLERQHPPKKLPEVLARNKTRLKGFGWAHKFLLDRWDIMYPPNHEQSVSLGTFDAAMCFWFLRFVCSMKRPNDFIWRRKPNPDDQSEAADIARIRDARNFLINLSQPALYEDEYERKIVDFTEVTRRLGGEKHGLKYSTMIEDLHSCQVRYSDMQFYMDILTRWADETSDRQIAPAKLGGDMIQERKEMTMKFLERHRNPKVFVRSKVYNHAKAKLDKCGSVVLKGNTGDGKTTTAISLMVSNFDEDECLLITSPEQWDYVDPKAINCVLIDDIFGSGSLDEKMLNDWLKRFRKVWDSVMDTRDRQGLKVIITIRQHILDQCASRLADYELFDKEKIVDIASTELLIVEKRTILYRHLNVQNQNISKSEVDKAAKNHQSKLGYPQTCAIFASHEPLMLMGSEFFRSPVEHLRSSLDAMYDLDKFGYLAMVVIMFEKDGILFLKKLTGKNGDEAFAEKIVGLAHLCDAVVTADIREMLEEALSNLNGAFVKYYADRDCYTFAHESIMEAVMATFGERHPQEVLEGCTLPFLMDFVGTEDSPDEGELFIMKINREEFDVLARVFNHFILHGEVKRISQHRALKDLKFLDYYFQYLESSGKLRDVILVEDNNFVESDTNRRNVGILYGAVDQEIPNKELVKAILATGIHDRGEKKQWCKAEKMGTLLIAVKRGSFDIYKALIDGGVQPPEKILLDGDYLVSLDIIKDFLERRTWTTEQKNIALVKACRGVRPQSTDIAMLLILSGAHVNCVACRTTPLCEAAKAGKTRTLLLLLGKGADIEQMDSDFQSPLHHACDWNNVDAVKVLLRRNADVNARDGTGFSPLHVAAGWGRDTIFQLFTSQNANFLQRDDYENTILHICAANGQYRIMKLFMDKYPEKAESILISRNKHGWTPLDFALRCGHLAVSKMLIYTILRVTGTLKSDSRTFVQTRFLVVKMSDFGLRERHKIRFLDPNLTKTCFQMPRGSWFIQAGSRDEYEKVRQFSIKFENKLRQCLAKS